MEGDEEVLLKKHGNGYAFIFLTQMHTRLQRPVTTLKIRKGNVEVAPAHLAHGEDLLLLNVVHGSVKN